MATVKSPRDVPLSLRVKVLQCRHVQDKGNVHVKLETSCADVKTDVVKLTSGSAEWSVKGGTFTLACEGAADTLLVSLRGEKTFGKKDLGALELPLKALKTGSNWYAIGEADKQGRAAELQLDFKPNGFTGVGRVKSIPVSNTELERRFAELVQNLAITDEKQRDAMFAMPAEMKWNMLQQAKTKKDGGKATGRIEDKPEYWINKLQAEPSRGLLAELRVLLSTSPLSWLQRFVALDGVTLLVKVLKGIEQQALNHIQDKRYRHDADDLALEAECVRCLRMVMNNELGLRAVVETEGAIQTLCLALDSNGMEPPVKQTILKLLTVTAMLPPDGHRRLLRAMNEYRLIRNDKQRFVGLIKALKKATTVQQQLAYMYLINALINSPSDIDLRVAIRSEFLRLGVGAIVQNLKQVGNAELELQIDLFEEETQLDERDMNERFEALSLDIDLDDSEEVFRAIRDKLQNSGLTESFHGMLRNLLLIPPDTPDGQKLWLLISRFVRQVSVQREAIGATDENEIQLDTLLVTVEEEARGLDTMAELEKANHELKELKTKYDALVTESADQLTLLEAKDALLKEAAAGGSIKLDGSVATQGGDVKLPGGAAPITGGPPGPGEAAPITGGPPPPGMAAPVTGGPPPPPMMGGKAAVGGGPPPPPPMMMKKFKWKKTPAPKAKLKGFQWAKMPSKDADKTVFKKFQDADLPNFQFDFAALESAFAIKAVKKIGEKKEVSKDEGTVNVLDGKISQNLSIWLSQYKTKTHAQLTKGMMQLDSSLFTAASIKTLLSTLPGTDGVRAVQGYLSDGGDPKRLGPPEQFTLELAKVPEVEVLLQAFLFVLEFESSSGDVRPSIEAVRLASREVFASSRFQRLLQVVYWLGNFMNGSTARGDAPGFKLESLNKIQDTKTTDNKQTLLYHLCRQIKQQDQELLHWPEDLKNVYGAARVSLSQLTSDVKQLKEGVAAVKQAKTLMPGEHRALHNKLEAFLLKAEGQVAKLVTDMDKMTKGYVKMAEQYGVNGVKVPPDEFFGMLQTFADNFISDVKKMDVEEERMAKEEKRSKAKALLVEEFKKKNAAIQKKAAGKKKGSGSKRSKDASDVASKGKSKGKKDDDGDEMDDNVTDDNDMDGIDVDDDDGMDNEGGPGQSMFDSMLSSLQAGDAFASRRKGGSFIQRTSNPASPVAPRKRK